MNFQEHFWNMSLALEEAEEAYKNNEVPVGAVIASAAGKILARAHNEKERSSDPCGHAEILAIRMATKNLKNWRLEKCKLYVTLEPCVMCMGAMVQARISCLVFGAYDSKGGALSLNYNLHQDSRLNHRFSVIGGIKHYECSKILSEFFRERRKTYSHSF